MGSIPGQRNKVPQAEGHGQKKKKKKKKKSRYLSRTSNLSRTKNPDLPFFEGSYSLELYNLSLFTNT